MARPKEFDKDEALDAAIGVFREHGFAGASAGVLTEAMKIGRQSLYDTFGDKWQLYCAAIERYSAGEISAHRDALRNGATAFEGIRDMIQRVVEEARRSCLGVGSICEFGVREKDLVKLHAAAGGVLMPALSEAIREAQAGGDVGDDLDPGEAAAFLVSSIAGIRIAARGGARDEELQALGRMALRALR